MAQRTKVLFMIESLGGGGAEKVLYTLVKHIDKTRFDVTVCPITDIGTYSTAIKKYVRCQAILPRFPKEGSAMAKLWWRVKHRLVHKILPSRLVYRLWVPKGNDVEVAFVEGLTTKILSKSTGKSKKLAWVHTDFGNNHWTISIFKNLKEEKTAYHRFDKVIGVSEAVTKALSQLFGDNLPTATIYNPTDIEEIRRLSLETPADLPPKKPGVIRICSTGRFVPQKGFDRLIRITRRLKNDGFNIELWLLGDGELMPQMIELIKENNLSDTVKLWGFKGNPYAYMAACDLFVCSSLAEGYSTAVTEALILGLPVVTTRCSGMEELLGNDNRVGIITDNSEDDLFDRLKQLLSMDGALATLADAAHLRSSDFSIEKLTKSIEDVIL